MIVHAPADDHFSSESDSDPDSSSSDSSSDSDSESSGNSGESDDEESKLSALENDPLMVKLMDQMLERRGLGKNSNSNSSSSGRGKKSKRVKEKRRRKAEKQKEAKKKRKKDKKRAGKKLVFKRKNLDKSTFKSPVPPSPNDEKFKSPSDTIIFRPALKQKRFGRRSDPTSGSEKVLSVDQLSQILSNFRVAGKKKTAEREETSSSTEDDEPSARAYANQDILEAEKFKAAVTKPNGESPEIFVGQGYVPQVDYDAEKHDAKFFAVSCHVDDKYSDKIKYGKYVDLHEIRPDKRRGFRNVDDEQKMELVHSNGMTYFAPKKDKGKIDGVKRWNEAFRVYAMIYSRANPHRAAEIFQYIDTVNSAASSFVWENVAYYDFLFRKLMDENTSRSWAVKCQELWSESMRDPFSRSAGHKDSTGGGSGGARQKTGTCWHFNSRQGCRKSATACRFEHRCNHCGGTSHGYATCRKRPSANEGGTPGEHKKLKKDKKDRDADQ